MNAEQLKLKAKELGIKDAENLKGDALKKAVKEAEQRLELVNKAKTLEVTYTDETTNEDLATAVAEAEKQAELSEKRNLLVLKANSLGITDVEGMSNEEFTVLILATENSLLSQKNDVLTDKVAALAGALGIDNYTDLDANHLTVEAALKIVELTPGTKTEEVEEPVKGKTDKSFKAENGNHYGFKETAPAAFRFLGAVRTQEEWIKDIEAMELMIVGNLTYVELVKK